MISTRLLSNLGHVRLSTIAAPAIPRVVFLVVIAVVVGVAEDAWACSCVPRSPCSMFQRTNAIFLGTVVDVKQEGTRTLARLEVTRTWKGTVDQIVTVSDDAGTSCSFTFTIGQRFLVYGDGAGGTFRTHMCAGGGPLRPNEPEPNLPPAPRRVSGRVTQFNENFTSMRDALLPLANVDVAITADGRTSEARTDVDGDFTFNDVPAGRHLMVAKTETGLEGTMHVSLASTQDCASVLIWLEPSGRLAGTVRSDVAPTVGEVDVLAVPTTHDWSKRDLGDTKRARTAADGSFEIRGLKPGEYFLTVNVLSAPMTSNPFAPSYYPGVDTREKAIAIVVGTGAAQATQPFVLQKTLPSNVISAVVVCRDGSVPRSSLVYATPSVGGGFLERGERTGEVFNIKAIEGVAYNVFASVSVPIRDAIRRETATRIISTPRVLVSALRASDGPVRLVVPLDRCHEVTQ